MFHTLVECVSLVKQKVNFLASTLWSLEEVNSLANSYAVVKPKELFSMFPGRTEGAVKSKILHMQKSGALPEAFEWTVNEALFITDVYRHYTVEELHVHLRHPKWSIQHRVEILKTGNLDATTRSWSPIENTFLIEKSPDLSVKEIAVCLNRPDTDILIQLNLLERIGQITNSQRPQHTTEYKGFVKLNMTKCTVCKADMKIRFNALRLPENLFCSMKCKFKMPVNKRSFMHLVLDEKKQEAEICNLLGITKAKYKILFDMYFDSVATPTKVSASENRATRMGKREDLHDTYMRSTWEANVARVLNIKKKKWEYEPQTFVFKGISRGAVTYTPDFHVKGLEKPNEFIWIEVKGRMNPGDYTKLLNFKRLYPKEFAKVRGVVAKNSKAERSFARLGIPILWYYNDLKKEFKSKISNWEGS